LFDELKLEKFPSLKRLSAEITTLTASQETIKQNLKAAHQEYTAISNAEHNARMLLGYKKLETTGYAPIIPKDGLRNIKPYKSPLVTAQRQEETAQYFNSLHLDIDCAYAIRKMINDGDRSDESIAKSILWKYGKERTEKVLAAFASTAATTQTIEAFQFAPPDSLIRAFKETAASMVFSKEYGWKLPWEVENREQETAKWRAEISMAERYAAAERKVKEQDRNPAPKKKRSYDHELG
jgi:hypothetical protein